MNLVLDIGNTLMKVAVFNGDELIDMVQQPAFSENELDAIFTKHQIQQGIFSSVRDEEATKMLTKYNFLALSADTPLPLANHYKTPETLGKDRVAGIVGASRVYRNENVLVIDMGTCVTYDLVRAGKAYFGGAISPGFEMRFKALNTFTGKLPKVNFKQLPVEMIGDSTENSILSGVYYGLKNEVQGVINQYLSQYNDLKVVLTGGDFELFDLEPKNRIFADQFLVLKGLNEILNYNADQ
ncbi:MAG: type III pantothenate kinase [Flavobacteriales bacterium]|nr:type III pantothenate kinase [Flavobacteriales bacterium]